MMPISAVWSKISKRFVIPGSVSDLSSSSLFLSFDDIDRFFETPSLMKSGSSRPLLLHLLEKPFPGHEDPFVFSFCHLFLLIIGVHSEEKPVLVYSFKKS